MLYVPSFCVSTLQSTQFMSIPFRAPDRSGPDLLRTERTWRIHWIYALVVHQVQGLAGPLIELVFFTLCVFLKVHVSDDTYWYCIGKFSMVIIRMY